MTGNGSERVRFGPFEVDLHTHEFWKYGTKLKLIGQPFEILAVLLSRPGELVTREELRARLWPGETFVDFNHGLNAAVNKLRDVLSDSAEEPRYVETLPRRGYRFIAKIERTAVAPATRTIAPPQVEPSFPSEAPLESAVPVIPTLAVEHTGTRLWTRYLATTVMLTALAVAIGIFVKRDVAGARGPVDWKRTRPLTNVADNTGDPAFSPDGNSLAFVRQVPAPGQSGIFVRDTDSDRLLQLTHNERDCCPVWSPDGRLIAFSRYDGKQFAIYVVPSDGGAQRKAEAEKQVRTASAAFVLTPAAGGDERKLNTNGLNPQRGEVDWSPDGKSIAFSAGAIFLSSLEGSVVRRLTDPPPDSQDWGPKFSADGQKILFVREHEIGLPAELLMTASSGGVPVRVVSEPGQITGTPQWSPDERSVIFASDRAGGHPALWRVALDPPGSPVELGVIGAPTWSPAVSRRGYRLAYQRQTRSLGIWQMDLSNPYQKPPSILVPWTSDTDQGPGPQFSPDGKKLAYMSDRSGTMEIWVSNRNGSDAFQLTNVGGAGTPRWSPDSQSVAFDTRRNGQGGIVTIKLQGGAPHLLVEDSHANVCPSWSRDGKWVYFASERSGDRYEVWKVPAQGGLPVQVTHQGGHAALESFDGKYIYYAKTSTAEPEVWRTPVRGGPETPVPLVRPGTWASWQIVNGGILFVGPSLGHEAVLSSYDFATRRATTLGVLHLVPFWLGATSDGKTIAFDQLSHEQSQIMLVENFR